MERSELIKRTVTSEERDYINDFCLNSSRLERIEVIHTLKQRFKSIKKDVEEAIRIKRICTHVADDLLRILDTYKQEFKKFNETQKTKPSITKELMLNFLALRAIVDTTLNDGLDCRDEIKAQG